MRLASLVFALIFAAGLSGQTNLRSGIHPEDMDTTCKPCTDFWRYANGAWLDKNPIPADRAAWGTFSVLADASQERLKVILEAAADDKEAKAGSNRRKIGDLYASCMDTAAIDSRGISPLQPDFDRIAAIRSVGDLGVVLSNFQRAPRPMRINNGAVVGAFRLTTRQDEKDPGRVIARLGDRDSAARAGSSILSLPDREYYFKDDQKSREIRAEFLQHLGRMLELSGTPRSQTEEHSKMILAFETDLAASLLPNAERRDPEKIYHLMTLKQLIALAPNYDWANLFRQVELAESTPINVTEPALIEKFNTLLTSVPLETWKAWLRWRTLQLSAPYLFQSIVDEDFHFERTVLAGIKAQSQRWRTCAGVVDRELGDALGQAYVEKYFPPEAKQRMFQMVEALRLAMRRELEQSAWMQPATKKAAIEKLNALRIQVGYPDHWQDYAALPISRSFLFENVRASWERSRRNLMAKAGRHVDRDEFGMTPPTINAYSSTPEVKLVFPAGILQPPFFDLQADDAVNYGAIGAVIGHEMGHQFDDGGSKFDSTGMLRNWWGEEDRAKFEKRTACVVDQFNKLDAGPGLRHNGKMVLGEALGDLGGLSIAYRAYRLSLAGKPEPPAMDGFTADQRFFIAFARVWGTNVRPQAALMSVNTDNHPLSQSRAIGTLQNIPEFHRAFQCKPGDAMVRPAADQCKLW